MKKEIQINGKKYHSADLKPYEMKIIDKPRLSKDLTDALFVISQSLLVWRNEISKLSAKKQSNELNTEETPLIQEKLDSLNQKRNKYRRNRTTILNYLLDQGIVKITGWYSRFENQPNLQLVQISLGHRQFVTQCTFKQFNLIKDTCPNLGLLPNFEPISNEQINEIMDVKVAKSLIKNTSSMIHKYKDEIKYELHKANQHDQNAKLLRKQIEDTNYFEKNDGSHISRNKNDTTKAVNVIRKRKFKISIN